MSENKSLNGSKTEIFESKTNSSTKTKFYSEVEWSDLFSSQRHLNKRNKKRFLDFNWQQTV